VIGNGKRYKQQVKDYITQNGLEKKIIFLSETATVPPASFQTAVDFPAIYQSALAMIYPSFSRDLETGTGSFIEPAAGYHFLMYLAYPKPGRSA
jgi:hypothetical protein